MSENVKPESLGERVAREFFGPPATGNSSKEASETCYRDLNAAKLAALVDRLSRPAPALPEDSRVIARLNDWCVTYGKSLCPPGADTFGEGMREAKKQVAHILASTFECRHENAGIPDPQDEFGRDAQYPAHVICPDCGADVEVR